MELDWLETFIAVVERGGFTAAAEHVHRSQSRVSAHIAALERELGVRLVDRSRRPATLTAAGVVFVRHAREIVANVGSARAAVAALRAMDAESLTVVTTPCIGAALFADVLGDLLGDRPGLRLTLTEHHHDTVEQRFAVDSAVLGVLPTLDPPLPTGMREHLLWREPLRLVVHPEHELARRGAAVAPAELVEHPLVVGAAPRGGVPDGIDLLAAHGHDGVARVAADSPHSVVAMVRAGAGVGVLNAIAIERTDHTGLTVLDVDHPDLVREVAAYWYDVLLSTPVGAALHRTVLGAWIPAGAEPLGERRAG